MGLADQLADHHRFDGLRSIAFGRTLELEWPDTPDFPRHGYVVTRHDLDDLVAQRAVKAGATSAAGLRGRGADRRARPGPGRGRDARRSNGRTVEVRGRFVVVADGANSRFGRALGTQRDRSYPQGMAIRGYFASPRHDEPWIESHLDIRDRAGNVLPGYGWIFPVGDGRVNVGIGLLSTFNQWKEVNTSKLMDDFVAWAPDSWDIRPETSCGPPTGGRLPMGLSVGPHAGPDVAGRRRRRGRHQPVQRRGHRLRVRDRPPGRRRAARGARVRRRSRASGVRPPPAGDVRPLFQGGARVRAHHRPARADAGAGRAPACTRARSWSGCCGSWPTCCAPTSSGPAEAAYRAVAAIARLAPAA